MIKSIFVLILCILTMVTLAGCGGGGSAPSSKENTSSVGTGGGSAPSSGEITSSVGTGGGSAPSSGEITGSVGSGGGIAATGVAKLSWQAPTNTDGPTLAGFKIHYGTSSGTYTNTLNVGMVTSYSVTGLTPGTYYFTVTSCDTSGNESSYSNEGNKTIS